MNVAFDIGGVLSKYPEKFRILAHKLQGADITVHVITDMHDVDKVYEMLVLNNFGFILKENVHCADYQAHGEGCKAELLDKLNIDLFFDDFLGYMVLPGDTIRCLVMPDPYRPYWSETWKTGDVTEPDFGRRVYKRP